MDVVFILAVVLGAIPAVIQIAGLLLYGNRDCVCFTPDGVVVCDCREEDDC